MPFDFDRRQLLGGACALLATGCARGDDGSPSSTGATGDTGSGSTPEPLDYPCGQVVSTSWAALPLADYPDLATVGGWYRVTVGSRALVVAHVTDGCYSAMLQACSHEGVAVDYKPDRQQYVCPRHGAVYAANGEKISGPQPTGLPVYDCGREGDVVYVNVT